jgi:predicted dehydrogenase
MKKNLKFGIIGAGGIAQTYAQAFQASECCQLVAVADTRREAANALAETCGARVYENYKDLAKNETGLDAVIVATPPATHPEIAIYFMNCGANVLCEKPLCLNANDAREMISAAERAGKVFTMASKFRYVEDVIKAKSLVASGILGEVLLFENAFTARVDMTKRWNSDVTLSGGGVLIDNGTHSVDIIRYFLGAIREVLTIEGAKGQSIEVEDNVRMFVKTEQGIQASVDLTWSINKDLPYFISIYGANGTLHVGWRESKYKLHSNPDWTVFGKGYDKVQAFRSKIENFAGKINGTEELLINPADALASVQGIEAAYASMNQNHWTPVKK